MSDANTSLPLDKGTNSSTDVVQKDTTNAIAPRARVLVGVTFDINGEHVTVTSADVANALEKGIEFRLPKPVRLGELKDLTTYMHDKFGVPADLLSNLPGPFHGIGTTLETTVFTVEEFHVKVPPKDTSGSAGAAATRGPTMYTMMMSAAPKEPIHITDTLQMERFHFGVSNEPEPVPQAVVGPDSSGTTQQIQPPKETPPPRTDQTKAPATA